MINYQANADLYNFVKLYSFLSALAGPDPYNILNIINEYLPVADLAGAGRLCDYIHGFIQVSVVHNELKLQLGKELDPVFAGSPLEHDPFLGSASFDFRDGQADVAFLFKRGLNFFQLFNPYYRFNLFHVCLLVNGLAVLGDIEPYVFFVLPGSQAEHRVNDLRYYI
jgi:hypothetical protein